MNKQPDIEIEIGDEAYHLIQDVSFNAVSARFWMLERVNETIRKSENDYLNFLIKQYPAYFWRFAVTVIWCREFNGARISDPLPYLLRWMELSNGQIDELYAACEAIYQPPTPKAQITPDDLPENLSEEEKKA